MMMEVEPSQPSFPVLGTHSFGIQCDLFEDKVYLTVDGKRTYGMEYEKARELVNLAQSKITAFTLKRGVFQTLQDIIRKDRALREATKQMIRALERLETESAVQALLKGVVVESDVRTNSD